VEQIRRHINYANVAATLALVLAMSGGAVAATGGFSSGGSLRACANEEGVIRLLKAGKHCQKGQKSVSWNQAGPVGPKGATGATGTPGAAGAPGAAGTPGTAGTDAPGTTEWAKVAANGQVIAGRGVTKATVSGTTDIVDFDRDITQCALFATQQTGSSAVYVSFVAPYEPEVSKNRVIVQLAYGSGNPVTYGFSVQAVCP
jgi:hypothetical protein